MEYNDDVRVLTSEEHRRMFCESSINEKLIMLYDKLRGMDQGLLALMEAEVNKII